MIKKIEYKEKGVIVVLTGIITSEELWDSNEKVLEYLAENHYEYQIFCFEDVKDFIISSLEMQNLAQRDVEYFRKRPVQKIAVVTQSILVYGMVRMYEAYAQESTADIKFFEKLEDAENWVNSHTIIN